MKSFSKLALLTCLAVAALGTARADNIFLNEFHYDNTGSDSNEFIEIAIDSSLNINNVSIDLYRSNGTVYDSEMGSSFTLGSTVNGISFYSVAISPIQNGPSNGIAIGFNGILVSGQFLSYEGTLTATAGLANGMMSADIGVEESNTTTPVGASLGLIGAGNTYGDFTWASFAANSKGMVNAGQVITVSAVPENAQTTICLLLGVGLLLGGERFLRRKAA